MIGLRPLAEMWMGRVWPLAGWTAGWTAGWVDRVEELGRASALPTVEASPAAALRSVVGLAQKRVVGRRMTFRVSEVEVEMTVRELVADVDNVGLVRGQLDDVRLVADDVVWPGGRLCRLVLTGHKPHLRLTPAPTLVAAPVRLEVLVPGGLVTSLVQAARPWLSVEVGSDALALRSTRWPHVGRLEVEPTVAGSVVRLRPRCLVTSSRRFSLPRRLLGLGVSVPDLPRGLRVTQAEVRDGDLWLCAVIDEWRARVSSAQLAELVRRLRVASSRLDIPRLPWTSA